MKCEHGFCENEAHWQAMFFPVLGNDRVYCDMHKQAREQIGEKFSFLDQAAEKARLEFLKQQRTCPQCGHRIYATPS